MWAYAPSVSPEERQETLCLIRGRGSQDRQPHSCVSEILNPSSDFLRSPTCGHSDDVRVGNGTNERIAASALPCRLEHRQVRLAYVWLPPPPLWAGGEGELGWGEIAGGPPTGRPSRAFAVYPRWHSGSV